jgi:hypothetical protein
MTSLPSLPPTSSSATPGNTRGPWTRPTSARPLGGYGDATFLNGAKGDPESWPGPEPPYPLASLHEGLPGSKPGAGEGSGGLGSSPVVAVTCLKPCMRTMRAGARRRLPGTGLLRADQRHTGPAAPAPARVRPLGAALQLPRGGGYAAQPGYGAPPAPPDPLPTLGPGGAHTAARARAAPARAHLLRLPGGRGGRRGRRVAEAQGGR